MLLEQLTSPTFLKGNLANAKGISKIFITVAAVILHLKTPRKQGPCVSTCAGASFKLGGDGILLLKVPSLGYQVTAALGSKSIR